MVAFPNPEEVVMSKYHAAAAAALALLFLPMLAHASCDTVKAGIDARIKAKGVSGFTLAVVPADQTPADGKVLGHCQGDQQIVYTRGADAANSGPASPVKAQSNGHVKMGAMGEGKPDEPAPPAPPASASSSGR